MAADTFTPLLGMVAPGTGNDNNNWGTIFNTSFGLIADRAIAGVASHAVTGGTLDLSASPPPAGPRGDLDAIQIFSGVLASNQILQVPNLSKTWLVQNTCTGAFTLTIKTPAGAASAAIPQGGWALAFCDGNNNIFIGLSTSLRDVQWLGADGTIALPGVSFASEPGLGLRRVSAGVMALTVGGVDILTISGSAVTVAATASFSVVPPGSEINTAAITAPTGWYLEFGQTIARSTDTPLMNAITQTFTATTNGTVTLTAVSQDLRGLGLEGSVLEGTGMFTGATIVSVDSATQITMSNAATNSVAGGAVRAFPFGNGDGSTTFTLPDARGSVSAGRDNMGGTALGKLTTGGSGINGIRLNATGGSETVTLTTPQIPSHTHSNSLTDPGHTHNTSITQATTSAQAGASFILYGASIGGGAGSIISGNTTGITINNASAGGGGAHNNAQWTRIRNVLIKR